LSGYYPTVGVYVFRCQNLPLDGERIHGKVRLNAMYSMTPQPSATELVIGNATSTVPIFLDIEEFKTDNYAEVLKLAGL